MGWARGLTRRQATVLLVAWLGWVFDVMDTALFAFAKQPMLTEMLGGPAAYKAKGPPIEGMLMAVFLVGWSLGGLGFGLLADRWGRARTLIVTILSYSILTGLTALARTPEQVAVARFLTGLGIGGEWAAGAALVAETFAGGGRAPAAGFLQSAAAFGPWLAAATNLAVPPGAWRVLFLVGVAPALVCVAIRLYVREPDAPRRAGESFAAPLARLFGEPTLRRNALVATILGVVGVTGAGVLPFWLPNLVREAGRGLPEAAIQRFTSYNTFTLHLGTLAGVIAFPWLAQRLGRRASFAAFFLLAPLASALAIYGGLDLGRLLVLLPVATFFSIGVSAGFVLYFPELFPASLRATGAGLAYNVGRIFSAILPAFMGLAIAASGGRVGSVVLLGMGVYLLGLLALPFAPETKGKPLPEERPMPTSG